MSRSQRNIPTVWVVDLDTQEQIDEFKKRHETFMQSDIGQKLIGILNTELKAYETAEVKIETYDTPSWSHKQAHMNGGRQAIRKLLKLLGEND